MIAGLAVGWLDFMFAMAALVYGAPIPLLLYFSAGSSVALLLAGITSLSRPDRGRTIALLALAGLGTVSLPLVGELVPQHNIIVSPLDGAALVACVGLLAFVLLYPKRLRFSIAALLAVCLSLSAFAASIYKKRVETGEYARPAYACFRWYGDPKDDLVIARDPFNVIGHEVRVALTGAGIAGTLEWTAGSWENRDAASRLLVLAQSKPRVNAKLFPARSGLLIYAYDGERWITYPAGRSTYPLYLTLETQGSRTMIYQPVGGSKQGTQAFSW